MNTPKGTRYWLLLPGPTGSWPDRQAEMICLAMALRHLQRPTTFLTGDGKKPELQGFPHLEIPILNLSLWRATAELHPERDLVVLSSSSFQKSSSLPDTLGTILLFSEGVDPSCWDWLTSHSTLHHIFCSCWAAQHLLTSGLGIDPRMVSVIGNPIEARKVPYTGVKQRLISYSLQENGADTMAVLQLLRRQSFLEGWELMPIRANSTPAEIAAQLLHSWIFLAFPGAGQARERLAEAMACGCFCIGSSGPRSWELLQPAIHRGAGRLVEQGDWMGYVEGVQEFIITERMDPATMQANLKRNSDRIHATCSRKAQRMVLSRELVRVERRLKKRMQRHGTMVDSLPERPSTPR